MRVLVECYPDQAVLEALGVPRRQLLHLGGKGEVVKRVRKLDCAIGMIDEDPNSAQPRDLANYAEVEISEGLRLCVRRDDPKRKLLIVCPRLEEWLVQRAKVMGIGLEDYGLPEDPDRLHGIPHYERKEGFSQFMATIVDLDEGMKRLRRWVCL